MPRTPPSLTAGNTYELAEYDTENDFTIVAGSTTNVSQAINLPTISNQTYGAIPINLNTTTTSGLPVTYSISGPATISGGILTITGAGTVVITANQAGNSTYLPTTQAEQFTVYQAPLTLAADYEIKVVGQTFMFTGAQYTSSGLQNGDAIDSITLASAGASASAGIGSYPITISNATGSNFNPANYAITYRGNSVNVIAAPLTQSFVNWASTNSVTTGMTGVPYHDGVPNLLKFVYDLGGGPIVPDDFADLPTWQGHDRRQSYLALSYRLNASATGVA